MVLQRRQEIKIMTFTPAELKSIRLSFGLSQADFAQLLGIHLQTWCKWERGVQKQPAIADTALRLLIEKRDA